METELTWCPECGAPAEAVDRFTLPSTHGPIEHVKTRCIRGPWFVTPVGYDSYGDVAHRPGRVPQRV